MSDHQAGNVVSDDEQEVSSLFTATPAGRVPPQPTLLAQQLVAAFAPGSSTMAAAAAEPPAAAAALAAPTNPATSHPMTNITDEPGIHDVLLGRGGGINNRPGNIRFRDLVRQHKVRYIEARKIDKPKVAVDVVRMWRSLDPPGRFLERTKVGGTGALCEPPVYHDVGDKKAQLKASQCLRERTPEVMKLVKEQEHQRRIDDSRTDVLIPVCRVGTSMPASTDADVLRWTHDKDYASSSSRNVEFRSLMTSRAYRVIPLYYVQNCQRRCIMRTATAVPITSDGRGGVSASSNVEYLALLAELKNSYKEEEMETDRSKKRKIAEERGTQLVATNVYRYSWVRGIPQGRIELTGPMDHEKVMIDHIYPQLIPGEVNFNLPKPLANRF
jgi:hypothetical protein